jgi:hypothetical protein
LSLPIRFKSGVAELSKIDEVFSEKEEIKKRVVADYLP